MLCRTHWGGVGKSELGTNKNFDGGAQPIELGSLILRASEPSTFPKSSFNVGPVPRSPLLHPSHTNWINQIINLNSLDLLEEFWKSLWIDPGDYPITEKPAEQICSTKSPFSNKYLLSMHKFVSVSEAGRKVQHSFGPLPQLTVSPQRNVPSIRHAIFTV